MSGVVGSFDWEACDTCKHSLEEGGCELEPDWSDFSHSEGWDFIVCTRYEPEDGSERKE